MKKRIFSFIAVGLMAVPTAFSEKASADDIGIKNFRQIIASYSVITGVRSNDPDLQPLLMRARTRLPLKGTVDEVSSPMILGLTEVAGAFCSKMVERDAETLDPNLRRAHRRVNFQSRPSSLSGMVRDSVIEEYTSLFWQREPNEAEREQLRSVIDELVSTVGSSSSGTKKLFRVLCTTVATSLEFLTY